ncbi:acyl-CoA dehydrogenase [Rhodococcus sp. Leaf7]|uniref:acyl-CoA dehydrogenase family protein n=1 Tax=unclassified Rhodococcus (in: high G+C Gram-positive bacteria) TaxID=192944 RepID=UPI00070026A8|nr:MULTISPECIES: acyl-CoA dehydrogenase family protein [unclassified Rhodococcus (in: high G+C Gram-positive bacteria)]KQU07161.1 acyl-CoA dehydrogenase [Rhodococcus sp. Leaf7]KQU42679.1 acyl-CoA dehydrogenase [Rhodococcus sp. Leaf247]
MTLELTVEQRDLQSSLRSSLARTEAGQDVRPALLEMGLTEIPFPERFGGAGFTLKDTAVVMTELGRSLGSAPYLSSVILAGFTVLHAGSESARAQHLPEIADGSKTAALVTAFPFAASPITATAGVDDTLVLDGAQEAVVDGADADLLIVVATGPDGPELAVIEGAAAGVIRTPREALDFTRSLARIEFSGAVAHRVTGDDIDAGLDTAQAAAITALAAEQVGSARACLEMSVEYAKTRHQFGRAIGSFQAIKHRLTDMLIAIELAEAAVLDAAGADERSRSEFVVAAATARMLASRAATFAAEESVQIHGGIGFTWEHPLHRYFRRAKTSELLFGATTVHAETVAADLI